jgi:C1A family cysteine protease
MDKSRRARIGGALRRLNGWRRDIPDHRDFVFSTPAGARPTPRADLRPNTPRMEDQGPLGSCTSHASTSAMEYLYIKLRRPQIQLSRLFLYYTTRVWIEHTPPSEDSGCMIRDVMKALAKHGVCEERLWPYTPSRLAILPSGTAIKNAANHQILSYWRCPNLTTVKQAVAAGYPVIGGFAVPASIDSDATTRTGILKFPGPSEAIVGAHAVLFIGYDDSRSLLAFENSWGRYWGDKGFGYLPYEYFTRGLADDCWTIRAEEM